MHCEDSIPRPVAAVPRGGPARPSISTALLTPYDRIARKPLAAWARQLVNTVQRTADTARTVRTVAEVLTSVVNNAGLIAAMRGEMRTASTATERHIQWLGRLARRSRATSVASYAVQPWINLGRIEARTGQWHEALARYSALWASGLAGLLQLGTLRLADSEWSGIASSREQCLTFLHGIYVADSLAAMLLNRQFDLIQPFARNVSVKADLAMMCEEACIIADSKMGDHRQALARATIAMDGASGWSAVVMRLRTAETYACAGDPERARALLVQLAALIRQASPRVKARPEFMPILARLARACHEVELKDDAHTVAIDLLAGARDANDEMFQIEMLQLLACVTNGADAEDWRRSALVAEETTDYAQFRSGAAPRQTAVFVELYAALEAACM